ncbi:MAG: bifunctional methylenetetrahydrofolate dehydrogenase/methenyltetrahydrofolate cyclohydrolase FolD [Dehalococcoidia bacterium]|nr:bifunctional methylenetetrahydrofolate dehydrogenase/methenyltetrahydrofolate cyclohydrolase FolD [Dehalococcoidia bacterium]
MAAKIIDGAKVAQDIRAEVARGIKELQDRKNVTPGLVVVLVGDDPASATYVRSKGRACQEVGAFTETIKLPKETPEAELLSIIERLNHDPRFHGILVQLPLPKQISERKVTLALSPEKDVDGLHPMSMGHLMEGEPSFVPCTPGGIQQLLIRYGYDPAGKHVVVCGRSNIVGKPIANLLMQKRAGANATVTVCHTGTKDLASFTRQADIIIAAAGSPRAIKADMVKPGVVIIDVGINRVDDPTDKRGYRIVGDVDYEPVAAKAEAITPVPGGVGPMTIAMLLSNTLRAAKRSVGEA